MNINDVKKALDLGMVNFSREEVVELFAVIDRLTKLADDCSERELCADMGNARTQQINRVLEADITRLKGECRRAWDEVNKCNRRIESLSTSLDNAVDENRRLKKMVERLCDRSTEGDSLSRPLDMAALLGYEFVDAVIDPLPIPSPRLSLS